MPGLDAFVEQRCLDVAGAQRVDADAFTRKRDRILSEGNLVCQSSCLFRG